MKDKAYIFILIDALGWEYLERREFLEGILKYKGPCRTVLGYSTSAIPAIFSGKLPSETGIWNAFYYSPATSIYAWMQKRFFLPLDNVPKARVITRKLCQTYSQRRIKAQASLGIGVIPLKYLYLFDRCDTKNLFVEPLGGTETIFDYLRNNRIPYFVSLVQKPDLNNLERATQSLNKGISFYFLYLSEMDGLLHQDCRNPEAVANKIKWYEGQILKLYHKAKEKFSQVEIFIFSDHGMTPTKNGVDLAEKINKLKFRLPEDYVVFYDATMARFWFFNEQPRQAIKELLSATPEGHILSGEELVREGIYFADNKFGELIFLMNPGYVIEPSFMGNKAPQGMHGFDPADKSSDAFFASNINLDLPPKNIKDIFVILKGRLP